MKVIYLPLESYRERYTYQLKKWTQTRFADRGVQLITIDGEKLPSAEHIRTSVALDPFGRSYWSLIQMARLVKVLDEYDFGADDAIYTQDMFYPGFSAIPYILSQLPHSKRPKVYTHCLAQSVDPEDFTFPMRYWMRHYELMVDQFIQAIFIASGCQRDQLRTAMFGALIVKVGLAFDMHEVRERVPNIYPYGMRVKRIVFASRFDREKQPHFFMDFVDRMKPLYPDYTFAILSGQPRLRSNDPNALERARMMEQLGRIVIYDNLPKNDYYKILASSKLHVNTAKQDFVSNTLNEASALETPSLCPAYLSFPEALNNERRQLYVPWSLEDMVAKATHLLQNPLDKMTIQYSAVKHHKTLDKVITFIQGDVDGQ